MKNKQQLYRESAKALRTALKNAQWWPIIQDEVKHQLEIILDNFDVMGPAFKEAFVSLFRFESLRRHIKGLSLKEDQPSVLFGSAMTEEVYQSALTPVRAVLDLNDWVEPNEADVQACLSICNHADHLDSITDRHLSFFEDLLKRVDAPADEESEPPQKQP